MRGVKKIQLICRKTGINSNRKEEPENCKLEREKRCVLRRTGNDYPAACYDIVPKAMRNRCCVYERGPEATASWSSWAVEIERVRQEEDMLSKRRANVWGMRGPVR